MLAAIRKAPAALGGEAPAIAWPAGTAGLRAGFHQLIALKAAQVAPHHLNIHPQLLGQLCSRSITLPQQQGERSFVRGGGRGRHRPPSLASGDGDRWVEVDVLHPLDQSSPFKARFLERLALHDQAAAAGAFVDHGGAHGIVHIVMTRSAAAVDQADACLLYTSPSPRDRG